MILPQGQRRPEGGRDYVFSVAVSSDYTDGPSQARARCAWFWAGWRDEWMSAVSPKQQCYAMIQCRVWPLSS